MKTKIAVVGIACLLNVPASADALFPSPSVPNVARSDGWVFALGAGNEYEAEYDGSDDYGVELEPVFAVQRRNGNSVWFLEGQELGWRSRVDAQWLVQAGLRFEGGRESSESDALTGLADIDDEIVVMGEVRRGFGENWNNWVAARIMAGDSDIGELGVLAAGHTFGANRDGTGVDVFAFVTLASSSFINRDFGISAADSASSGLAQYRADGGYRSAGIQVVGRWEFGENWQLFGEVGYERYSSDIADSPIALDDFEAEVGLNLAYIF
ncbi:MAG: MipA/OmpV family protein [Pseudomonadota bacterium]